MASTSDYVPPTVYGRLLGVYLTSTAVPRHRFGIYWHLINVCWRLLGVYLVSVWRLLASTDVYSHPLASSGVVMGNGDISRGKCLLVVWRSLLLSLLRSFARFPFYSAAFLSTSGVLGPDLQRSRPEKERKR